MSQSHSNAVSVGKDPPHATWKYSGAKITAPIEVRVEALYGIATYLDLIRQEIADLDAQIDSLDLSKKAFRLAEGSVGDPTVTIPDEAPALPLEVPADVAIRTAERRQPPSGHRRRSSDQLKSPFAPRPALRRLAKRFSRSPLGEKKSWEPACDALRNLLRDDDLILLVGDVKPPVLEAISVLRRSVPVRVRRVAGGRPNGELQVRGIRVPLDRPSPGSLCHLVTITKDASLRTARLIVLADPETAEVDLETLRRELVPRQAIWLPHDPSRRESFACWGSATEVPGFGWIYAGPPGCSATAPSLATEFVRETGEPWPKISLITISYNQVNYVRECIESVLCQGYPNLEFIVIDAESTDGTREILEEYRNRFAVLVIEPDRGQSDGLNKGLSRATGDVVNWLCTDDRLEPGALFEVGRVFREERPDVIAGGCRVLDGAGAVRWDHHNSLPLSRKVPLSFGDLVSFSMVWQKGAYFFQPEVFFSREIWQRSGAFVKENLFWAMDYDLYLRFALAGAEIIHIPPFIGCSRQHQEQKTRQDTMDYLPTVRRIILDYQIGFEMTMAALGANVRSTTS